MSRLPIWKRGDAQRDEDQALAPVSRMRLDWDRLFDRILDDVWSPGSRAANAMPMDLTETAEQIRIRAEVPGIDPDRLEISLTGDVLTLSGEKVEEQQAEEGARHYSERYFGSYQRSLKLPCAVDVDNVRAEHKHGVLTITLQKAEAIRPKRIKVRSSPG